MEAGERGPRAVVATQQVDALARRGRARQHVRDVDRVREPRGQEATPHLCPRCARGVVELRRGLPLRVGRIARRRQPPQRGCQLSDQREPPRIRAGRPRQYLRIAPAHATADQLRHVPVRELRDGGQRQRRRLCGTGALCVLPQGAGDGRDGERARVAGGLPGTRLCALGGGDGQESAGLRLHAEGRGGRGVSAVGRPQQARADAGIEGGLGSGNQSGGQQLVAVQDGSHPGQHGGPMNDPQCGRIEGLEAARHSRAGGGQSGQAGQIGHIGAQQIGARPGERAQCGVRRGAQPGGEGRRCGHPPHGSRDTADGPRWTGEGVRRGRAGLSWWAESD